MSFFMEAGNGCPTVCRHGAVALRLTANLGNFSVESIKMRKFVKQSWAFFCITPLTPRIITNPNKHINSYQ